MYHVYQQPVLQLTTLLFLLFCGVPWSCIPIGELLHRLNQTSTLPFALIILTSQAQMVRIQSHAFVTLDLGDSKILSGANSSPSPLGFLASLTTWNPHGSHLYADPEWVFIHKCIVNWLCSTSTMDIQSIIMQLDDTATFLWTTIGSIFHDNCLTHAVCTSKWSFTITASWGKLRWPTPSQLIREENPWSTWFVGLTPSFALPLLL